MSIHNTWTTSAGNTNMLRCWVKKKNKNQKKTKNSLSAVLKDFQLASIQFCPVKLGDGVLHVAARCKLDHTVLKNKKTEPFTRTKVWRSEGILGVWRLRNSSHPSFLLGLCASTKVTSPAFLIRSFRSCFKPQRRFSGRENTAGCHWEPFRPAGRNVSKQKKPKHNDTVINYWLLSLSDMLPFQWRACQQKSNR